MSDARRQLADHLRRGGAPVQNLPNNASFHSKE
jgi:hypothetical protein